MLWFKFVFGLIFEPNLIFILLCVKLAISYNRSWSLTARTLRVKTKIKRVLVFRAPCHTVNHAPLFHNHHAVVSRKIIKSATVLVDQRWSAVVNFFLLQKLWFISSRVSTSCILHGALIWTFLPRNVVQCSRFDSSGGISGKPENVYWSEWKIRHFTIELRWSEPQCL